MYPFGISPELGSSSTTGSLVLEDGVKETSPGFPKLPYHRGKRRVIGNTYVPFSGGWAGDDSTYGADTRKGLWSGKLEPILPEDMTQRVQDLLARGSFIKPDEHQPNGLEKILCKIDDILRKLRR